MCGIAGLIAEKDLVVRRALQAMVACQKHRGPDDEGVIYQPFGHSFLGLGQRRLSIIDLSAAGHQPMVHPESGDQLTFNGEIYNFQTLRTELEQAGETFIGHSDTEVMLRALTRWGPDVIKRFEGMFAFAFLNHRENKLVLARDAMGIKPLYVADVAVPEAGRALLFASEVRAILGSGLTEPKLDPRGVAGLLAYGAPQQPLTVFEAIRSFPAGCYQVVDAQSVSTPAAPQAFWKFPRPKEAGTEKDTLSTIRSTLDAAVRDHLVADVPVGVFLSSGIDSTILAGLAAKHTPHLRSFTVGFSDQPDLSEQELAGETAKLFGLEHTAIDIDGSEALSAAVAWLDALDQPSVDGLNVYLISRVVRAQGIVVALSGQGGDELFGGYPSFAQVPGLYKLGRPTQLLPRRLRAALAWLATIRSSKAVRDKLIDMFAGDGSILQLSLQRRRVMSRAQMASLGLQPAALNLSNDFEPPEALTDLVPNRELDWRDIIWSISQVESRFYQGNMLLRDSDANAMAHGLEIRVPMLDQKMLDYAFSLPGRVRLPSGKADKHLLRAAFPDLLRPELLQQKKRGFTLPIRRWMLGPMRELCEEALSSLKTLGILQAEGIDSVWQSFLSAPETPIWSRAFTLVVLGHYVRRIGATV